MKREYYSDTISNFLRASTEEIIGRLALGSGFPDKLEQRTAWVNEIDILRPALSSYAGAIHFEYSIPRMGERIDVLLIIGPVIFVLEFKTGAREFTSYAIDQVTDYALDLKNFHETSHDRIVAPVLIATNAPSVLPLIAMTPQNDKLLAPIKANGELLGDVLMKVLAFAEGEAIDWRKWESGRYSPTPTIMEAALALYRRHTVAEISRSDASAINLGQTSDAISEIIRETKDRGHKRSGSSLMRSMSKPPWIRSIGSLTEKRTLGLPITSKMWPRNSIFRVWSSIGPV